MSLISKSARVLANHSRHRSGGMTHLLTNNGRIYSGEFPSPVAASSKGVHPSFLKSQELPEPDRGPDSECLAFRSALWLSRLRKQLIERQHGERNATRSEDSFRVSYRRGFDETNSIGYSCDIHSPREVVREQGRISILWSRKLTFHFLGQSRRRTGSVVAETDEGNVKCS